MVLIVLCLMTWWLRSTRHELFQLWELRGLPQLSILSILFRFSSFARDPYQIPSTYSYSEKDLNSRDSGP